MRSYPVHLLEYIFLLHLYLHAYGLTEERNIIGKYTVRLHGGGGINNHHHIEITASDGLRNIKNIDIVFCEKVAYICDDPNPVFSYYRDNGSFQFLYLHSLQGKIRPCRRNLKIRPFIFVWCHINFRLNGKLRKGRIVVFPA